MERLFEEDMSIADWVPGGGYVFPTMHNSDFYEGSSLSSGIVVASPFLLTRPTTFDRVGVAVRTSVACTVYFGIYASDPAGLSPTKLVYSTSWTLTGGMYWVETATEVTLGPGVWWGAYVASGATYPPRLRALGTPVDRWNTAYYRSVSPVVLPDPFGTPAGYEAACCFGLRVKGRSAALRREGRAWEFCRRGDKALNYWTPSSASSGVSCTETRAFPFYVPRPTRVTTLGVQVVVGSSGKTATVALYTSGATGFPGKRLVSVNVSVASSGLKVSSCDVKLSPGWYWGAAYCSSSSVLFLATRSSHPMLGVYSCFTTSGSPPDPFGSGTLSYSLCPVLFRGGG